MKVLKLAAFLLALLSAAAARPAEPPAARLFSGVISDSECGLDHSRMKKAHHLRTDRQCTRDCCEKFKQEYVLADHTTGEVYQLDDQKKAARFPAALVRILGTLDAESGTIHVQQIERVR